VPISERERGERRQGTARPCPGSLKNAKGGANIGGEYCEAREKSSVGGGNFESANLKLAVPHAEESTSLREMYGEEEVLDYPMDGAPPLDLRGGFGPPSRPRRKKKKPPSGNGGNGNGRRGKSKKRESSGERRGRGPRRKHRSRSRSGDAHQQQQHQAREAGPHQPAHWDRPPPPPPPAQRREGGGGGRRPRGRSPASPPPPPLRGIGAGDRGPSGLPDTIVLSPRADAWVYLAASSVVAVTATATALTRYQSSLAGMPGSLYAAVPTGSAAVMALGGMVAAVAFGAGGAYRFKRALRALTRPASFGPLVLTAEGLLAGLVLFLWFLAMIFFNSFQDDWRMVYALSGETGANIFGSLWASGILSMYLVADFAAGNRGGVRPSPRALALNPLLTSDDDLASIRRTWAMISMASIALLFAGAAESAGSVCAGPDLASTPYCSSATASAAAGTLGFVEACGVAFLGRLRRRGTVTRSTRRLGERLLGLACLIGYAVSAGVATGPGGAGADANNVFVASWLAAGLAVLLNVSYLGRSLRGPSSSGNDADSVSVMTRPRGFRKGPSSGGNGNNGGFPVLGDSSSRGSGSGGSRPTVYEMDDGSSYDFRGGGGPAYPRNSSPEASAMMLEDGTLGSRW